MSYWATTCTHDCYVEAGDLLTVRIDGTSEGCTFTADSSCNGTPP
jgi:hypothetical protein